MAKEEIVYFTGPVKWAKVFEHNMDDGEYAPEGGQFTIDIGLRPEDVKTVLTWNKMYEPKDDEDYEGVQFLKFKRKNEHRKKSGKLIKQWSGPPKVIDKDGNEWDDDDLIGNGSVCTIKLAVAKVKRFTYVRLEAVRVDEWVEYVPDDDDDSDTDTKSNKKDMPF